MTYLCQTPSPLGSLTLAADGERLTGLWIEGQKYFAATVGPDAQHRELPVFAAARSWLARYFAGERPPVDLPLAPAGSAFRQRVWEILCEIPYGRVITYGSIAQRLAGETGKNMSAQAVGGAVGHNPISIIIPCHRLVSADGSLTGYAGGIDKKISLLRLEGVPMEGLFVPARGSAL